MFGRKLKVLICDDEKNIVEQMTQLLVRYQSEFNRNIEIMGVTNYDEGRGFGADLIFLDIEMPGRSGLEIKEELEKNGEGSLIIFVTSHVESVWEAFGRNVIGFFEKPTTYERLCALMKKFYNLYSARILVNLDKDVTVESGEICYIVVKDIYSEVYFTTRGKILLRKSLATLEELLPEGDFLRISNSCIVFAFLISA